MLNLHEGMSETAPLCEFSATRRTSAFSSLSFFHHNAIILTRDYSLSVSVKKGGRGRENILQILQPFAFLALDSLSELAIACACGRRLVEGLQLTTPENT